ncbi:LTXXQ motif family protein [Azonexus fungiphilus]|uniref:LTXXQ motif family protein n=1 Tax=Azonexus fungiphilus TaxID=146940 RepID=A0A495VQ83_9RHOO|nr:Spy/CpxP family protein refolding chaperone [Azonexus fungiphilus]RKT50757.1 LTXXQ motif family protein [Azonexus fungiphilus]
MSKTPYSLLLLSMLALAACAPIAGRGGPDGAPPSAGGGCGMAVESLDERLRKTADALKLTPPQNALWETYQAAVGALLADQRRVQGYRARQDAAQQIAGKVDAVRNRLSALEDIQDAAGKLYAALDEGQRKQADALLAATVPGLDGDGAACAAPASGGQRPSGRTAPGGGMGGPGGGMGGGFGRM